MLKAIILDDEQHCIDKLSRLLNNFKSSIQLIGSFSNVQEAISAIENLQPNVVFLDVHLQNETGFDFLKKIIKIDFEVVFITAYDSYAIEAFKFSALDYILKPIDIDDLEITIEKLKKKESLKNISKKIEVLFNNLEDKPDQLKKIAIPTLEGLMFIKTDNIIRCQSDSNYTHIYLNNKKKLTVAKTLKHFEKLLGKYNFFRLHQSHLVNLASIDRYIKGKGGYVILLDGTQIEVAVRRKEAFMKKLLGVNSDT